MNEFINAFSDVLDKDKPYPVSFSIEIDTMIYLFIAVFLIVLFIKYA